MKRLCSLAALLLCAPAFADNCEKATTQTDLNVCAAAEYQQADAAMNASYKKVMDRASDAQRELLKTAQNAWLKVRDADCAFVSSGANGGSVQPMIESQCLADKTRERTAFLESLTQCEEGDVSCPLPPSS